MAELSDDEVRSCMSAADSHVAALCRDLLAARAERDEFRRRLYAATGRASAAVLAERVFLLNLRSDWPLISILDKLVEAEAHMSGHGCDPHGYEQITYAAREAARLAAAIRARGQEKAPSEPTDKERVAPGGSESTGGCTPATGSGSSDHAVNQQPTGHRAHPASTSNPARPSEADGGRARYHVTLVMSFRDKRGRDVGFRALLRALDTNAVAMHQWEAHDVGDCIGCAPTPAATANFLAAYDAWVESPDHCGGELFDAMLRARENVPGIVPSVAPGSDEARCPQCRHRITWDEARGRWECVTNDQSCLLACECPACQGRTAPSPAAGGGDEPRSQAPRSEASYESYRVHMEGAAAAWEAERLKHGAPTTPYYAFRDGARWHQDHGSALLPRACCAEAARKMREAAALAQCAICRGGSLPVRDRGGVDWHNALFGPVYCQANAIRTLPIPGEEGR